MHRDLKPQNIMLDQNMNIKIVRHLPDHYFFLCRLILVTQKKNQTTFKKKKFLKTQDLMAQQLTCSVKSKAKAILVNEKVPSLAQ